MQLLSTKILCPKRAGIKKQAKQEKNVFKAFQILEGIPRMFKYCYFRHLRQYEISMLYKPTRKHLFSDKGV